MDNRALEQTLILIKPDALKNSLTGYILSQLSEYHTGVHFSGTKVLHVSKMLAEEHYAEHRGKVFFPSLLDNITGKLHYPDDPSKQRVIAIVYQGPDAIKKLREVVGPTNPHEARTTKPGCIRALGTVVPIYDDKGTVIGDRMENLIHASANYDDAEREVKLWFKPNDIPPLMRAYRTEVNGEFYYYKDKKLYTTQEPDSFCFLVPDDIAWKSDIEMLRKLQQGQPISCTLESIVAKYLINHNYAGKL
ncbi:nucleoside-diphosphate kinase [Candidatus Latescibacterota bacterium]